MSVEELSEEITTNLKPVVMMSILPEEKKMLGVIHGLTVAEVNVGEILKNGGLRDTISTSTNAKVENVPPFKPVPKTGMGSLVHEIVDHLYDTVLAVHIGSSNSYIEITKGPLDPKGPQGQKAKEPSKAEALKVWEELCKDPSPFVQKICAKQNEALARGKLNAEFAKTNRDNQFSWLLGPDGQPLFGTVNRPSSSSSSSSGALPLKKKEEMVAVVPVNYAGPLPLLDKLSSFGFHPIQVLPPVQVLAPSFFQKDNEAQGPRFQGRAITIDKLSVTTYKINGVSSMVAAIPLLDNFYPLPAPPEANKEVRLIQDADIVKHGSSLEGPKFAAALQKGNVIFAPFARIKCRRHIPGFKDPFPFGWSDRICTERLDLALDQVQEEGGKRKRSQSQSESQNESQSDGVAETFLSSNSDSKDSDHFEKAAAAADKAGKKMRV